MLANHIHNFDFVNKILTGDIKSFVATDRSIMTYWLTTPVLLFTVQAAACNLKNED